VFTVILATCKLKQERINDIRVEGKGRSVQQPRKSLKFENVPTVVLLLSLA